MAYVWGRPNLSPYAQNQTGATGVFAMYNYAIPPQFHAQYPCPLYAGCDTAHYYQWLDPVYPEYRDTKFPRMGSWPPPQAGTPDYTDWVNQQRQWMPYEIFAYNGVLTSDACSDTRGRPNQENNGQTLHFDFTSDPNFPFITSWNGVRLCVQMLKHSYVVNSGGCCTGGPVQAALWVKKTASAYPTPPTWGEPTTLIQSLELDDFGLGCYQNPYGFNILDAEYETLAHPGGGAWNLADIDKYWFHIGQPKSAHGNTVGNNNGSLGIRKVWAALIVNLGGAPAATVGSVANTAVVG